MLIYVGYWFFLENEFYNLEVEGDAVYCHDAKGSLMSNLEDELKDICRIIRLTRVSLKSLKR